MILSVDEVVERALRVFGVRDGTGARLIKTGIGAVDRTIGGLLPGEVGILAAKTGVGKSSVMLHTAAALTSPVGIISLEDGPEACGARLLSGMTRVNSLDMRKGLLDEYDKNALLAAQEALESISNLRMSFPTSKTKESVLEATRALCESGCSLVWLDYIHKIHGAESGDRKGEVASILSGFQGILAEYEAAGMAVSQVRRMDGYKPRIHDLKDSGDLENEARIIIIGWVDPEIPLHTYWELAKAYCGGYSEWAYRRGVGGVLEEVSP